MSFFNDLPSSSAKPPGASASLLGGSDLSVPLHNLSTVQARMDTLHKFLFDSVNRNTLISKQHMDTVSSEITSAIHQTIVNGAALLVCTQNPITPSHQLTVRSVAQPLEFHALTKEKIVDLKMEVLEEEDEDDYEIIEIDAVEILAEHIHFCDICGKGFKRDANLRMHMRAHGNQYKTTEALAKPERFGEKANGEIRKTRFSCPYVGCNRNKEHKKFRALKSVICVKNHFKRSHCPKMYSCNRCNKKSFSVIADFKNHLKHCGENKWKCSCGTSFSRKDKLFGHMTLFEGHMPAVMEDKEEKEEEEEKGKEVVVMVEDDEDVAGKQIEIELEVEKGVEDNEFFDEFLDGLGPIDNYCFQDLLRSPDAGIDHGSAYDGIEGFFNF